MIHSRPLCIYELNQHGFYFQNMQYIVISEVILESQNMSSSVIVVTRLQSGLYFVHPVVCYEMKVFW
jgi:hypothetical protein